jgi:phosphoglycerate dehydrogenase-like enzyme
MPHHTLLVLGNPADPVLGMLDRLPDDTRIAAGNSKEAFVPAAPEADAILLWDGGRELLREVWSMAPQLRWVHCRFAGVESILFDELVASPVLLTNARGVFSGPLAEFAIGAILFFAKDFRRLIRNQAAGRWERFDIQEVSGRTLGLVGYGDIGRAVAARARALGMRVGVTVRRRVDLCRGDPLVDAVFSADERRELIAMSDYLVVAAPLTAESRALIGEPELRAMRPDAVLINVGRGAVVGEAALIRALEQGRIRGAALDVFEREPLPPGHPFYRLDNVLLSPHCADHTPDWRQRSMEVFLDNFERFRTGAPLRNLVDKAAGY